MWNGWKGRLALGENATAQEEHLPALVNDILDFDLDGVLRQAKKRRRKKP